MAARGSAWIEHQLDEAPRAPRAPVAPARRHVPRGVQVSGRLRRATARPESGECREAHVPADASRTSGAASAVDVDAGRLQQVSAERRGHHDASGSAATPRGASAARRSADSHEVPAVPQASGPAQHFQANLPAVPAHGGAASATRVDGPGLKYPPGAGVQGERSPGPADSARTRGCAAPERRVPVFIRPKYESSVRAPPEPPAGPDVSAPETSRLPWFQNRTLLGVGVDGEEPTGHADGGTGVADVAPRDDGQRGAQPWHRRGVQADRSRRYGRQRAPSPRRRRCWSQGRRGRQR